MNKITLAIFMSILCRLSYGQIAYIETDSSFMSGYRVEGGTETENAQYIKVWINNKLYVKKPEDLAGYGLNNGLEYVSRTISMDNRNRKVFLEKITSGNITLLRYAGEKKSRYFLEKDSTEFRELYKDMQAFLEMGTNCVSAVDAAKSSRFNKTSLGRLIELHNNCTDQPLPKTKYGFVVGVINSTIVFGKEERNELLSNAEFDPAKSLSIGLTTDIPLRMSNFSIATGMTYSSKKFSVIQNESTGVVVLGGSIDLKTIDIPFLFRYKLSNSKIKPFLNVGATSSANIKNNNSVGQYISVTSRPDRSFRPANNLTPGFQVGLSYGGGVFININNRLDFFSELRLNHIKGQDKQLGQKQFNFTIGLMFN